MEQIANDMRANRGKLNKLANRRGMELAMEHPQLMDNNMLEPTEPQPMSGGGDAGMKRVIGRGRPKKIKMAVEEMDGGAKCICEAECECRGGRMYGGAMVGGAMQLGRSLAEQMMKIHGPDFMAEFSKGLTAHGGASMKNPFTNVMVQDGREMIKPGKMKGGRGPKSAPPSGLQVSHASMSSALSGLPGQGLGGQDVPPGGVAPVAYGSAPQAPASFQRNSVGMGKAMPDAKHGGRVTVSGAGRSARGQAISKLMKNKGLTLGQASKYLKEHPEEMK